MRASEGAEVIDLGIVADRLEDTVAAIRRARDAKADVLVTMGGASVGDYDLVQKALSTEGIDLVVLEDRDASGPAADARPSRRDAGARPARQSGLGLCLRVPVPGAAAAQDDRAAAMSTPSRAGLAGFRPAGKRRTGRLSAGPVVRGPCVVLWWRRRFRCRIPSMGRVLAHADCLVIREPHAPRALVGSRLRYLLKLPF